MRIQRKTGPSCQSSRGPGSAFATQARCKAAGPGFLRAGGCSVHASSDLSAPSVQAHSPHQTRSAQALLTGACDPDHHLPSWSETVRAGVWAPSLQEVAAGLTHSHPEPGACQTQGEHTGSTCGQRRWVQTANGLERTTREDRQDGRGQEQHVASVSWLSWKSAAARTGRGVAPRWH